jgi:hypothetical protein
MKGWRDKDENRVRVSTQVVIVTKVEVQLTHQNRCDHVRSQGLPT